MSALVDRRKSFRDNESLVISQSPGKLVAGLLTQFTECFARPAGRKLLQVYIQGLLSNVQRQNAEAIALDLIDVAVHGILHRMNRTPESAFLTEVELRAMPRGSASPTGLRRLCWPGSCCEPWTPSGKARPTTPRTTHDGPASGSPRGPVLVNEFSSGHINFQNYVCYDGGCSRGTIAFQTCGPAAGKVRPSLTGTDNPGASPLAL